MLIVSLSAEKQECELKLLRRTKKILCDMHFELVKYSDVHASTARGPRSNLDLVVLSMQLRKLIILIGESKQSLRDVDQQRATIENKKKSVGDRLMDEFPVLSMFPMDLQQ
jgi:hypothetical protein